jgi:hypothetical protein
MPGVQTATKQFSPVTNIHLLLYLLHHFESLFSFTRFRNYKKKKNRTDFFYLEEYPILLLLHVLVIHSFVIIGILIFISIDGKI